LNHNGKKPVLQVRYRRPEKKFGASLILSGNGKGKKAKGRILSVTKVPREKILRVHEYLPFNPDALLKEFREQEKSKGGQASG
jgi:hypothetical protein